MSLESFSGIAPIAQIAIGAVLLFFGRKLFWLFVAVAGFLFGWHLGTSLLAGQPTLIFVAAVLLGIIGAVLAIFLQKIAIVIAGGVIGGLVAMRFAAGMAEPFPLLVFAFAAIVAAVVCIFLFDWALVVFSSLAGTGLILESLTVTPSIKAMLWLILLVIGIVVQARSLRVRASDSG